MNSIDTNILVYATDETNATKHATARRLLERALKGGWPIAAQVYGEYFSVVTRKRLVSRTSARQVIDVWSALMPPMPSSVTAHIAALNLATEKQVQYWDALIIAICAEHGVTQLYTEDAPSAPKLLGVKCVSPW
jgi:predicted nucleic acid-binding protein